MKHVSNVNAITLAALMLLAFPAHAYARFKHVPGLVNVSLPGGGNVAIQIDNFENPRRNSGTKTLLAVHGLAHTGATFEPLANELFKKTGRDKIGRVLALNLPGRNGSGLPSNLLFGNLTMEDYTAVLLGVLDQLSKKLKIESLVGHSMGGLIVQMAQSKLRSGGTSLEKAYGIKNVYLLAPSIPNPLPWLFADSGAGANVAVQLIDFNRMLGSFLRALSNDPDKQAELLRIWLGLFFRNSSGEFAPGTPFTTALELNYVSNEALVAILQLLGANGFVRPSVSPEIFNKRVQRCFRIVTFSEDLKVPGENLLQEIQNLDSFLTGNKRSANVVLIDAPDAVHDMYIANPSRVAKSITACH